MPNCTHSAFPFAGVFSETATHQDIYNDVMRDLVEHSETIFTRFCKQRVGTNMYFL